MQVSSIAQTVFKKRSQNTKCMHTDVEINCAIVKGTLVVLCISVLHFLLSNSDRLARWLNG